MTKTSKKTKPFPCPSAEERKESMTIAEIRKYADAFKNSARKFKQLLGERKDDDLITFRMIAEHRQVCKGALNIVARTLPLIIEEEDAAKIFMQDSSLFFGNDYLQTRLTPENAALIYALNSDSVCPLGDFEFSKELVQRVLLEMSVEDAIENVADSYINYADFDVDFLRKLAQKKNAQNA